MSRFNAITQLISKSSRSLGYSERTATNVSFDYIKKYEDNQDPNVAPEYLLMRLNDDYKSKRNDEIFSVFVFGFVGNMLFGPIGACIGGSYPAFYVYEFIKRQNIAQHALINNFDKSQ